MDNGYPVQFAVEYPDRELNRLTTFLRIFTVIPIVIVLFSVTGFQGSWVEGGDARSFTLGGAGALWLPVLLMIVFRRKYPRWWFEWNRELMRFSARVLTYALLMEDRYPSTEDQQHVRLDFPYPDAERELSRWMPLVKWLLAIPHYVVLGFLWIAAVVLVFIAWFAILFTGRFPRGMFEFVEGVMRWTNRVYAYAALMVTDRYPPFRLDP